MLHRISIAGWLAVAATVVVPASAQAQYVAPPPDPGFKYIFDGTATGSDASFDKWAFAAGTAAQSKPASEGGQGQATLDPVEGSFLVGASPFGSYWYPVKPFGDAVFRLQYTVQNTPTSTRNGGIMVRTPEVRYTGATTNDVLAQKPTGYNYDVCGAALPICGLSAPAASTTYSWAGASGPFPPASNASDPPFLYDGVYCARSGNTNLTNLAGTGPLTHNGNANNHQHWTQVACGHEVQINETLTGTGPLGGSDPIKTGSIYNFRNLNAQQSHTNERLEKGVWHKMEIRTIGQQYTVVLDGRMINQFDNSIPKIASRNGDPATVARQFARGYLGLQTHGGNDRISYREIQVKEITPAEIPVNTAAPTVTGTGFVGQNLTCNQGTWTPSSGVTYSRKWYRSNKVAPTNPHFRAPSQIDLGSFSTPADPAGLYGNQDLTWLDSLLVDEDGNTTYTPTVADAGKVIHCALVADNGGATVWKTAVAPEIQVATTMPVGGNVPATLSLTLGAPASFGNFLPGLARDYDASTTATVVSSAGDATLGVSDRGTTAIGYLVNPAAAASLSQPLQVRAKDGAFAPVGGSSNPTNLLTYTTPVFTDTATVDFKQTIPNGEPLRTGPYAKSLTFTLSTTNP
jgi:hypothetical protein